MNNLRLIFGAMALGAVVMTAAGAPAGFESSDSTRENTYRWARDMALS